MGWVWVSCKEMRVPHITVILFSFPARAFQMRATSLVYELTLHRLRVRLGAVGKKPEAAAQGVTWGVLGWPGRRGGRRSHCCPGIQWRKEAPPAGARLSLCFARDRKATPPGSGAGHHAADRAPRAAGPRAGEGRAGGRAPWRWARLGVSCGASGRWADEPRGGRGGDWGGGGGGDGDGRASTGGAAAGAAEEAEAAPGSQAAW